MNEDLKTKIESVISQCCVENESNTPDFILAEYLLKCLDSFNEATKCRDTWYGVHLEPANKYFKGNN